MKIAISGKGGVGKTTFAANFAQWLSNKEISVLAVDADPDASLGTILGISDDVLANLKPIVDMKQLIEERMGGVELIIHLIPTWMIYLMTTASRWELLGSFAWVT